MQRDLLVHPHTKTHVAQFLAQPSHALLLVGPNGIGKTYLAEYIMAETLKVDRSKLAAHPYISQVRAEKDSISIEAIRTLQHFLQLKTTGKGSFRRAVLIEHAGLLTIEAQNAYLKLLEEPPVDTLMILTVDSVRALLPTIISRLQTITITAPSEDATREYFSARGAVEEVNQAYFLSGGLPGLMHALLDKDTTHPLLQAVASAKEVLQKSTFERLAMVETMSKQRDEARYTLKALQHIAQTGLDQASKREDAARIKQWHHVLKITTSAADALSVNANTKLALSNLMLHL